MNITSRDDIQPLTPQTFHILLALAERPLHGYDIARQCRIDSEGAVQMGTGSLYTTLKRLVMWHLIALADKPAAGPSSQRKRYQLTNIGWVVLKTEIDRYRRTTNLAETRLGKQPRPNGPSWS